MCTRWKKKWKVNLYPQLANIWQILSIFHLYTCIKPEYWNINTKFMSCLLWKFSFSEFNWNFFGDSSHLCFFPQKFPSHLFFLNPMRLYLCIFKRKIIHKKIWKWKNNKFSKTFSKWIICFTNWGFKNIFYLSFLMCVCVCGCVFVLCVDVFLECSNIRQWKYFFLGFFEFCWCGIIRRIWDCGFVQW